MCQRAHRNWLGLHIHHRRFAEDRCLLAIRLRLNFEVVYSNSVEFIRLRTEFKAELMFSMQVVSQALKQDGGQAFTEHWEGRLSGSDPMVVHEAHNWGSHVDVMAFGDEDVIYEIPCATLF